MAFYRRPVIVPLIIVINVAVFLMWMTGGPENELFMERNFLVSWDALHDGRWWTLLTSVFSHNMFLHIFINMFVLNSFGSLMEQVLGRMRFLRFYLVAGIVASVFHCVVSRYVIDQPGQEALGASGAVVGIVVVFSLLFPKEKILLFGLIPMPALWGALAFVGIDLWGLSAQSHGGGLPIGHGAHLGGAFTGAVYYFFYLRRRINRNYFS